jgi:hypothetical protein
VEHTNHPDELIREVAATSLARHMPEHPALQRLTGSEEPPPTTMLSDTSMLIHGTWARNNVRYQPPNDFWKYITSTFVRICTIRTTSIAGPAVTATARSRAISS